MWLDKEQPLRQLLQLAVAVVVAIVYDCYLIFIVCRALASPLKASEKALLAIERYSNYRTRERESKANNQIIGAITTINCRSQLVTLALLRSHALSCARSCQERLKTLQQQQHKSRLVLCALILTLSTAFEKKTN